MATLPAGMAPPPSGNAVTGTARSWKYVRRPNSLVTPGCEPVIETHVSLVLIVDLVRRSTVVVRGAGRGRQRIAVQEGDGDGIHRAPGNHVAGERRSARADGGGRIVDDRHASGDRLGEDALPLQQRRHGRCDGSADVLTLPLIVHEEERAVLHDRPAEHAAELVPAVLRLRGIGLLEVVPRVEVLVPEELEQVAMKGVAPRLGREVDHAAIETAELGGRAVALDLELLDGVDDRAVRELTGLRLEHRNAVEEILVGARPAAVDTGQDRIGGQGDARCDGGEHDEEAAVQGQLHDLFVLDDGAEARGFGAQDRPVPDDRHLFLKLSHRELEIDARLLACGQEHALTTHRPESRALDIEPVLARGQAGRRVGAIGSRHDDALQVRPQAVTVMVAPGTAAPA